MIIGSTGVGKTTLLDKLGLKRGKVRKTESIDVDAFYIDTPGEFLDIPRFYNALIVFSPKARVILLVIDALNPKPFPSNLSKVLRAPVLGVINKIDLLDRRSDGKLDLARRLLKNAGVKEVYEVSAVEGTGMDKLKKRLEELLGNVFDLERGKDYEC